MEAQGGRKKGCASSSPIRERAWTPLSSRGSSNLFSPPSPRPVPVLACGSRAVSLTSMQVASTCSAYRARELRSPSSFLTAYRAACLPDSSSSSNYEGNELRRPLCCLPADSSEPSANGGLCVPENLPLTANSQLTSASVLYMAASRCRLQPRVQEISRRNA